MTPHRARLTRQRNISVLREALRRVIAHSSAFTVADIGSGIDSDFLSHEVPPCVTRLVARLVDQGLVRGAQDDSYTVPPNGTQALLDLTKILRRPHPLLEEVAASSPAEEPSSGVPYVERLLRSDILDDSPEGT